MTRFEPGSYGIGSDRAANCATTTVLVCRTNCVVYAREVHTYTIIILPVLNDYINYEFLNIRSSDVFI